MQLIGVLFTGALTLFLVRALSPDGYGVFALALSVSALLLLPADLGLSQSAARFIAERRGDRSQMAAVLGHTIAIKAIGTGVVAIALVAAAEPIAAAYGTPELAWPLRIVAIALVGQSFMALFIASFEAVGRNALGFRLAFSESAVEVGASVALVLAGAGVTGAVAGRAIGFAFGGIAGLIIAARMLDRPLIRPGTPRAVRTRQLTAYAGALFVIDTAFVAMSEIDTLLIGGLLDPSDAGLYRAPTQIIVFAGYLGLSLAGGVAPRLARGTDGGPNVAALEQGLRLILLFQFFIVAPIVVWATPLVDLLFGPEYGESADVVRGLGPYILLTGPAPLLALSINYLGEARSRVPIALAALAVNALVDLLLIERIGIVAGAIGTDLAFLVFVGGHVWVTRRLLGLDLGALGKTVVRAGLAALLMAAVLLFLGGGEMLTPRGLGAGLLAAGSYVGVIVATGELSVSELSASRLAIRRRLARR